MMIIYFSGGGDSTPGTKWRLMNEYLLEQGAARLLSFAYVEQLYSYCKLVVEHNKKVRLMVDSGAFTAWSLGKQVDLEALSSMFGSLIDTYSSHVEFVLINLDVIPGRKGVDATPKQIHDAMVKSQENFKILNARYPNMVLPVFHQDEPLTYLHTLHSECNYVCLSPRNDLHEQLRVAWARGVANLSTNYHGLAATGADMMRTVPWYSVDSASWIMCGAYGGIYLHRGNTIPVLKISDQSSIRGQFDMHYDSLSPVMQKTIADEVAAKGFDIVEMRSNHWSRYKWNALLWLDWERTFTFAPQPTTRKLFNA